MAHNASASNLFISILPSFSGKVTGSVFSPYPVTPGGQTRNKVRECVFSPCPMNSGRESAVIYCRNLLMKKKTGSNLFTQVLICFRKKIKIRPEKKSLSGKAEVCPEKAEKPVRKS
jgi:hypothetical protein